MKTFLILKLFPVFTIISSIHSAYGSQRNNHRRRSRTYMDTDFVGTDDGLYGFNKIGDDLSEDEIADILMNFPSQRDEPLAIDTTVHNPLDKRDRSSLKKSTLESPKLGSNLWDPQSVVPEPPYMNSGGLPTGTNMYSIPHSKRGLIGSLIVMGALRNISQKYKYYGIYPSPYNMVKEEGFGKYSGKSAAIYSIFPLSSNRRYKNITRPSFGFMPMYLPRAFHQRYQGSVYRFSHYSIFSKDYVGKCHRPIQPKHTAMTCKTNQIEVICEFWCENSYGSPDITTLKENKCWHATGVWIPQKNMPRCRRNRKRNCDVRRLAGDERIKWVCTQTKTETKCSIKCQEPRVFLTAPAEEYYCRSNGTWTPTHIPKCVDPGPILRTVLWS